MGSTVGIEYQQHRQPFQFMSKKYEYLLEDDIRVHQNFDLNEEMYQHQYQLDTITKLPHFNSSPFEKYKLVRKIGERKFSKIYKGILLKNENIEVAIKEINAKEISKNMLNDIKYQINILKQLSHSSILRLIAVYEPNGINNSNYFITMEYLKGGEILNGIIRHQRYTDEDIFFYSSQIVAGIHYLHSKGIIHGHLLPENIILSHSNFHDHSQNHIKIVGFENADWITTSTSSSSSSRKKKLVVDEFLCPEISKKWQESEDSSQVATTAANTTTTTMTVTVTTSNQIKLTKESDLWSFGKILQLLLIGNIQPYSSPPPLNANDNHNQSLLPLKWTKILTELLQSDPMKRATSTDLLDLFSNNHNHSFTNNNASGLDLSHHIPSLMEYVKNHRKSYPLIVSSGIVHFHRGNRYEEEKVFASFQKPTTIPLK